MITYNTFIQRFKDFADNHYFIRSFSHGAPEDVDLDKQNEYPLMHVIYTGAGYEDTTKTLSFEVYIFDLPSHYENKQDRQKEVVSDAEQCAEDVIADIVNGGNIFLHSEDYTIASARVSPLLEESSNVLAGVLLEVDVQIPYERDACNAPIDGVSPEGGEIVYARRGVLRVRTVDSATDVQSVRTIVVPNGTLTDDGGGQVTLNISGAGDIALDDLTDVNLGEALDREALVYDEASGNWISGGPAKIDFPVYNATASTIAIGKVVGFAGSAQGDRPTISLFSASSASDVRTVIGVTMESIAAGQPGHVRSYGTIYGLNTLAYPVGTILYASTTAGELTSTAPTAPNHRIALGVVTRQHVNTGRVFVRNYTPGYELGDLSDVDATVTTETGKTSVLKWNATTSRYETGTLPLNQLKGVTTTGIADKDILIYNDTTKVFQPYGLPKTNGHLIIGGTSGPAQAAITAGTNITITNGDGTITVAAPNVVTGVTGVSPIAVTGTTAPIVSITAATASLAGSMSAADKNKLDGIATGAEVNQNAFSNVAVAGQSTVEAETKTDTLTLVAGSNITLTTDASTDSITIAATGGGGSTNSFETIAVAGQSSIVADSSTDTLTIAAGSGITLTTDATTDTLTITNSGVANNTFSTIAVGGQSNVVADSASDTLTLVAGTNMTITTDATNDRITFTAATTSAAGSAGFVQYNAAGAFSGEAALFYDAANNRLSVGGDTTPAATLTVRGSGTTTARAFMIEDSAGNEQFNIADNGQMDLIEDAAVPSSSYSIEIVGSKAEYWRPSIGMRNTTIVSNVAIALGTTTTFGLLSPANNPPAGGGVNFLAASGNTATHRCWQLGGFHGSNAPTVPIADIQAYKWSGTGSSVTDLSASEIVLQATNNTTGRFFVLGGGTVGIRTSAPTNTNGLTIRGQGTTTALLLLAETSAGTARFTIRDDGAFAFSGGAVGVAQTGYTTFTNLTTDRTCDANATTVEELADILGTLIEDLKTKGIIAA